MPITNKSRGGLDSKQPAKTQHFKKYDNWKTRFKKFFRYGITTRIIKAE
jgi:hypothetical protein